MRSTCASCGHDVTVSEALLDQWDGWPLMDRGATVCDSVGASGDEKSKLKLRFRVLMHFADSDTGTAARFLRDVGVGNGEYSSIWAFCGSVDSGLTGQLLSGHL
ncbi:hypothetical protein ALMP_20460 [Streptomyces sp. A012304]|nr:hypothetical protein ALMP_20460 [Streptomyces sp. A012304]